jgi:PleD family two-component response regulator
MAEKLRSCVLSDCIHADGRDIYVTVTIGIATIHINESLEQCIARADRCLYAGKNRGRNCSVDWLELASA